MNVHGLLLGLVVVALAMFMPPIERRLENLGIRLPPRKIGIWIGVALIILSLINMIIGN